MGTGNPAESKPSGSLWSFVFKAVLLAPVVLVIGGTVTVLAFCVAVAPLAVAVACAIEGRFVLAISFFLIWVVELRLIRKPWSWLFEGAPDDAVL